MFLRVLLALERDDFPVPMVKKNSDGSVTLTFKSMERSLAILLYPEKNRIHCSQMECGRLVDDDVIDGRDAFDILRKAGYWLVPID